MSYAKVIDGEVVDRKRRPTIPNVSSAHLLTDEELRSYGWYLIVDETPPVLNLDQRYGEVTYTLEGDVVVKRTPVIIMSLAECKEWVKSVGKRVAENMLQQEHPLLYIVLGVAGKLGVAYRDEVNSRIEFYINAYVAFAAAVDACNSKPELLGVWNSYPQLHEEVGLV
jgi:hypothetical protein